MIRTSHVPTFTPEATDEEMERLARTYAAKLVRCHRWLANDREDIQQELHLQLWLAWKHLNRSRSSPRTFLNRVAANRSQSLFAERVARCRDYRKTVSIAGLRANSRNPFRREEVRILRLDTARFIRGLSPKLRRTAIALSTHSPTDAALVLGVSRETIYQQISALRERFQNPPGQLLSRNAEK